MDHYSYVEEGHSAVGLNDLQRPAVPLPVRVEVQFMANGVHQPDTDGVLAADTNRALIASGMLVPAPGDSSAAVLQVTVDNRYEGQAATMRGLVNGLTFDQVTKIIRDDYEVTIDFRSPDGQLRTGHYHHAIITQAGKGPPPDQGRPMTAEDAFAVVISQSLLSFLGDMQAVKGPDQSIFFMHGERPQ